jgi:protoporphyrin/coproporphyrin ferrochelatase
MLFTSQQNASIKDTNMTNSHVGVMLMTYGSPATLDYIPTYLTNIRGGRQPDEELITEFRRRYALIGGSPLLRITREQATALQDELSRQHPDGPLFHVVAGMRFAPPFIADLVPEIATDAQQFIGVIMSPQYSPIIMSGYTRTLEDAVQQLHREDLKLKIVGDWHLQPYFLLALAQRVQQALDGFPEEIRSRVPVLLTAHSMPKRVIEKEPDYINNLKETAAKVAELVGLSSERWMFCYQSAGHTPEEWLKPDFADVMPELGASGYKHVLIAPVQFLADHLEILYDIEIGARQQAEEHGIQFARIESLNTSPLFIKALADVVKQTLAQI